MVVVNQENLIEFLKKGWLPLPQSIIPPKRECFLWRDVPGGNNSDPDRFLMELNDAVARSLQNIEDKVGIWFSGGIDSSTLLHLLVDLLGPENVVAFRLHFGYRDDEVMMARLLTDRMGVKLVMVEMELHDHMDLLRETIQNLRMPTSLNTQLTFIQNLCLTNDITVVLSALGLDELQAGYPAHVYSSPEEFERVEHDLLWRCQSNYAWNQKYLCKKLDVRFPFLDKKLVEYCRGIPREMKCRDRETKVLLREVMKDSLPDAIVEAGRLVGTKGGFVPSINKWWDEGLGGWASREIKKVSKERISKTLGSFYTLKRIRGRGNRWTQLRVASVPTFMSLVENDEF